MLEEFQVLGFKTICRRSGLKQISDIRNAVCKHFTEPENCTHASLRNNNIRVIKSLDFESYHKLYSLSLVGKNTQLIKE